LDLERSRIIAPYDAIVVRVDTTLGEIVVSELQSKPLLIVAEAGRMLAQVNVREDQIADIAKDSAAQVRVRDRWFDGIVTSVGLEPVTRDADGPLYLLEVGFSPASDVRLHVGESAIVRLEE
jgi:multidrug resistance efflux pump